MLEKKAISLFVLAALCAACGAKQFASGQTEQEASAPPDGMSERPSPRDGAIDLPPYPAELKKAGIEGDVLLQVGVDETGKVVAVEIIKDPGGGLGELAASSMRQELWNPALDADGRPVEAVFFYKYSFVIDRDGVGP